MIQYCPGGPHQCNNLRSQDCQGSPPCLFPSSCHPYLCVFMNEFSELSAPTHLLKPQNILPSAILLFSSNLYCKGKSRRWPQGEAVTTAGPCRTHTELWEHCRECSGNAGPDPMPFHTTSAAEWRQRQALVPEELGLSSYRGRYEAGPGR